MRGCLWEALGEQAGKEHILKAIKEYGRMIGEEVREKVEASGLEAIPENYVEDLPLWGMHKRAESSDIGEEKHTKAFGCVMGETWIEQGEEELGRLYCFIDPAKYILFNPNFKFVHGKTSRW